MKIMEIIEIYMRIMKIMKIIEIHNEIMKIMKIIQILSRIKKKTNRPSQKIQVFFFGSNCFTFSTNFERLF